MKNFYIKYTEEFTEEIFNKLIEWCNSIKHPKSIWRDVFQDNYENFIRYKYFFYRCDIKDIGYFAGVDNNAQMEAKNEIFLQELIIIIGYSSENNTSNIDYDLLLKEAETKYPIGTKYKPLSPLDGKRDYLPMEFAMVIYKPILSACKEFLAAGLGVIWFKGKWAEIISDYKFKVGDVVKIINDSKGGYPINSIKIIGSICYKSKTVVFEGGGINIIENIELVEEAKNAIKEDIPKFKIGDYVYFLGKDPNLVTTLWTIGRVDKIKGFLDKETIEIEGEGEGTNRIDQFRLALPHEIPKDYMKIETLVFKDPPYKVEFYKQFIGKKIINLNNYNNRGDKALIIESVKHSIDTIYFITKCGSTPNVPGTNKNSLSDDQCKFVDNIIFEYNDTSKKINYEILNYCGFILNNQNDDYYIAPTAFCKGISYWSNEDIYSNKKEVNKIKIKLNSGSEVKINIKQKPKIKLK